MKKSNHLAEQLKSHSLKATKPRLELLAVLVEADRPLTIKELATKLPRRSDTVTIYRNLETFIDRGLARKVDFQKTSAYFELVDHHDHHHLVCTKCDTVRDFTGCPSETMSAKILGQITDFATITSHSFEFFGLCQKCAKRSA